MPVAVVKAVAGCHLVDVRLGVQVITINERDREPCCQGLPNNGLSCPTDAHHDGERGLPDGMHEVPCVSALTAPS